MPPSAPLAARPRLRVFAPAKINWILTIAGRRPDGFHDIDTVFQALDWGDTLELRPLDEPCCRIICNDPAIPTGPQNLVARAWARLRDACPDRVGGVEAHLHKQVPAGAGLGGGSSDAAAMLLGLDRLFGLGLGRRKLEPYAAALGSDCPFFLRGGAALAAGRGERMRSLTQQLPPLWLVIVWPGFTSPTAVAYSHVRPIHWRPDGAARRVARALESGNLIILKRNLENVFFSLVGQTNVEYKKIYERMWGEGLLAPQMCGSGSAMFGLALRFADACRAARHLRQWYPVAVVARPDHRGVRAL